MCLINLFRNVFAHTSPTDGARGVACLLHDAFQFLLLSKRRPGVEERFAAVEMIRWIALSGSVDRILQQASFFFLSIYLMGNHTWGWLRVIVFPSIGSCMLMISRRSCTSSFSMMIIIVISIPSHRGIRMQFMIHMSSWCNLILLIFFIIDNSTSYQQTTNIFQNS